MFKTLLVVAGLSLSGCADFGRKFAHSDGLIDFAMALSGHEQIDAYPVERISSNGLGKIVTAHARRDARGVFVSGYVEKGFSPGWVTAAWSHIDVVVLDANGQSLEGVATTFSPSEIPASLRGIRGRSSYFARLPFVPPPGSTIKVAFHNIPISQCELGSAQRAFRQFDHST